MCACDFPHHLLYFILLFLSISLPRFLLHLVLSTEIIQVERLRVVHVTSHSAVLQWRPLLRDTGSYYELRYKPAWTPDPETRRILPGDSSWVELSDLRPDTTYTASLHPESNQGLLKPLSVNFTTLSGERRGFPLFKCNQANKV